jgi:hypothetical protein
MLPISPGPPSNKSFIEGKLGLLVWLFICFKRKRKNERRRVDTGLFIQKEDCKETGAMSRGLFPRGYNVIFPKKNF